MSHHSVPVENVITNYGEQGQDMVLSPISNKQIRIYQVKLLNRSGGLCDVGIMKKLADEKRKVFYYDTLTVSEITDAINANISTVVFDDTSNNSALIVQANKKFNLIGVVVSVAAVAGTFVAEYYNGASMVALPDQIQTISFAAGYKLLVFNSPLDWVVGGIVGTDLSLYTIRIRASAHPTNFPEIDSVQVASMIDFLSGVNINSGLENSWSIDYPIHLEANEGLIPFFSVAHAKNLVTAFYSQDN